MSDAVIYDRGYRSYQGELLGRSGARRAIVRDGIRRALGLRRKARRKVAPWTFLGIGAFMAAIQIGEHFAAQSVAEGFGRFLPSYPELFDSYSVIALMFMAIVMPELLGPDRREGVLSVYFSRPITVVDYLGAKAVAYLLTVSSIYLIPQLAFHLGQAALSADGFLAYLGDNLDLLWKILAATLAFSVAHGGVLAIISAHVDRTPFAATAFLAVITVGGGLAEAVSNASFPGARWFSLLAFDSHARYVRDWIFDKDLGQYAMEAAGFTAGQAAWTVVGLAAIGSSWLLVRYRRLV